MNRALWTKALADAWRQLLASVVVLTLFSWLFVWLMSQFQVGVFGLILNLLPGFVEAMMGVPLRLVASPTGQLSVLYVHVVTLLTCVGWCSGRGSDVVSGQIARGTMDLVLSLPVWRLTVLVAPAVVTALGSMLVAGSVQLGLMLGLACVRFEHSPAAAAFLPGTINLFCMTFCFTAVTTLVSSWGRDRWATISIAGGFFIFSLIVELVARLLGAQVPSRGKWLFALTFLSNFEPQRLILLPDASGHAALKYDLTLLGIGLTCYVAAAVIFNRCDIPGPR